MLSTRLFASSLRFIAAVLCATFPALASGQCVVTEQEVLTDHSTLLRADQAGIAVAMDGDVAVVGAWLDDDVATNVGAAYVYRRSGQTWSEEQKLTPADGLTTDAFGYAVAISGDLLAVGSRLHDSATTDGGAVYVYRDTGVSWQQEAKLTASDAGSGDQFGWSIAAEGDRIVIGANRHADTVSFAGAVYVFHFDGLVWSEEQKLVASTQALADYFGWSVALSGDALAVGAVNADAVTMFRRTLSTWNEEQVLTASDGTGTDRFGYSVALDGDRLLVGSTLGNAVYAFEDDGVAWQEVQKITASDASSSDWFGHSVDLEGDRAIVGARFDDDRGSQSGSAYTIVHDGFLWQEEFKLLASSGAVNDELGFSVARSGNTCLVGAPTSNHATTDSGAAYFFETRSVGLDISPRTLSTGTPVTLMACRGVSGSPLMLFVVALNGTPAFLPTPAVGLFDFQGRWSILTTLTQSPGPVDVTFRLLSLSLGARLISSNDLPLSLQ